MRRAQTTFTPRSPPGSNLPAGPTLLPSLRAESFSGLWVDLSPRGIFYVTQLLHLVHVAQCQGRAGCQYRLGDGGRAALGVLLEEPVSTAWEANGILG